MNLAATVATFVTILGFCLILATVWLSYKWRIAHLAAKAQPSDLPSTTVTTKKLVVRRGRIISASRSSTPSPSIRSAISSIRHYSWTGQKHTVDRPDRTSTRKSRSSKHISFLHKDKDSIIISRIPEHDEPETDLERGQFRKQFSPLMSPVTPTRMSIPRIVRPMHVSNPTIVHIQRPAVSAKSYVPKQRPAQPRTESEPVTTIHRTRTATSLKPSRDPSQAHKRSASFLDPPSNESTGNGLTRPPLPTKSCMSVFYVKPAPTPPTEGSSNASHDGDVSTVESTSKPMPIIGPLPRLQNREIRSSCGKTLHSDSAEQPI